MFSIAAEVLAGVSLEDVERAAVLGNVMERVVVLESAWTLDGSSNDERAIRRRIGVMARQARERYGSEQYVFLARSPASAQICHEETAEISGRTAVVLYTQKITATILYKLLSVDIVGLEANLYYKPPQTPTVASYSKRLDVARDEVAAGVNPHLNTRVIRKTSGAAELKSVGSSMWYGVGGEGKLHDMFNQGTPNQGFNDTSPITRQPAVNLNPQLATLFNDSAVPPSAQRPLAAINPQPQVAVASDLREFIQTKGHPGFVFAFLGVGGSGSTFMALNCAARIYSAGFTVAFIDADLTGRSAQYLTRLGIREDVLSADSEGRTMRAGFDLYGASQFMVDRRWEIPAGMTSRYDFTFIDLPYAHVHAGAYALHEAHRVIVTVDSSMWGVGKAVLSLADLPFDLVPLLRERGKLILNKSSKLANGLFGVNVGDINDIKRRNNEVFRMRADNFNALPQAAVVGSYTTAEEYWFSERLFADSIEGGALFDFIVKAGLS
jgi:cellulose biosynthesis protein BcsQ